MVTLKVLKARLDSSNVFYGVLRVVKMTSMAKFNEITKHAKVRDLSLRIPLRILGACSSSTTSISFLGIMTNSGKCGSINVNIMEFISGLLVPSTKIITYGKKGFSLCNKFSGYAHTIFESGSTSSRNLLISSRILSSLTYSDSCYTLLYNRYYGMTGRSTACYKLPSYDIICSYSVNFLKSAGLRNKLLCIHGFGNLSNLFDYLCTNVMLNALFENDLSECSARIQSLETALKNLEMIIEDLQKTYNKRRQAAITNELLEVISSTISI